MCLPSRAALSVSHFEFCQFWSHKVLAFLRCVQLAGAYVEEQAEHRAKTRTLWDQNCQNSKWPTYSAALLWRHIDSMEVISRDF